MRTAGAALGVLLAAVLLAATGKVGESRLRAYNPRLPWLLSDSPLYERSGPWLSPTPRIILVDPDHPKRFRAAKAPGAYRIVCLGQSTTEGYPFMPRGGYPEWLQAALRDLLKGVADVEVINAGACGSDSTRDASIVDEVLAFEPDIIVLYEGNNETLHSLARLMGDWLCRRVVALLGPRFAGSLRFQSLQRARAYQHLMFARFQRNVLRMMRAAQKRSARVVLIEQVNQDVLRQPMRPDRWNLFLASLEGPDTAVVDGPQAFREHAGRRQAAPASLLFDSIHPSLEGNQVLALAIARRLAQRGWIAPASRWQWPRLKPRKAYLAELGLSDRFVADRVREELAVPSRPGP